MKSKIYSYIQSKAQQGNKMIAALIDPDKNEEKSILRILTHCEKAEVDFLFIGGSLLVRDRLEYTLDLIKSHSAIPCILFPGSLMQISSKADAILFLSLISGRNPDLLIGNHVIAAPYIYEAGLETIATGYMLIHCGNYTTAHYMSGSMPIPSNKYEIAAMTALAGQMLGMQLIYMDGGSGAAHPIEPGMIAAVRKTINLPIVIGGGIKNELQAQQAFKAGADVIVVGNALESSPEIIINLAKIRRSYSANILN
ncbi:geranylgeranylglyceryl/heptaprenylglyceryl phosphate synthase [Thermaurantimonas sp.]|uniref:geranylgeranylglyceryl/heptaprenylglyceryl phosphate synthase n=1 Tax=Thermaurantimonas sp. TaxID=2681568 RepID=UPI00391BE12D